MCQVFDEASTPRAGDRDADARSDTAQAQQAQTRLDNVDQGIKSVAASVAELRRLYDRLDLYVKTLAKLVQQKEFRLSDLPQKDVLCLVEQITEVIIRKLPDMLVPRVWDRLLPVLESAVLQRRTGTA